MTAEQKAAVAGFLDVAGGFVRAGYFDGRGPYEFADDTEHDEGGPCPELGGDRRPRSGLAAGGGDSEAAVSRTMYGNSPPLHETPLSYPERGVNPLAGGNSPPLLPENETKQNADGTGAEGLDAVIADVRRCTRCALHTTRKNAVPGEGVERPLVLVVGEGPGADEDASGRPFVGAAGQLLDKMLLSIGLDRKKNCFIANVIKCRPPGNRDPYPDETAACRPFFERQLDALRPLLLLAVGKVPVKTLLGTDEGITRLRGNWKSYRGIPLLPTFHPSYLLRDARQKQFAWEDLKSLCRRLAEIDAGYAAETAELRKARNI